MSRITFRLIVAAVASQAAATTGHADLLSKIPAQWDITIGAQGRVLPTFEGADKTTFSLAPIFSISPSGGPNRFRSAEEGPSITLFETNGWRGGVTGRFVRARDMSDDRRALNGLGDTSFSVEPGLFIEYYPFEFLRARAEIRRGFGGHDGFVGDLGLDVVNRFGPVTLAVGPRLSLADKEFSQEFFGVNAAQSLASGLPVYSPEGGVRSYGAIANLAWKATDQITLNSFARYDRLAGDIASSPLVKSRGDANQFSAGLGLSYTFGVSIR